MNPPPSDTDASSDAEAALIRNEVKVHKALTATHREVRFTVGRRHGLGRSLGAYILAIVPRYEPDYIARWCAGGHVTVDGAPARPEDAVRPGQAVDLHVPLPPPDPDYTPPPLELLHHDARIAVANKAIGHLAHQAGRIMTGTLLNQLQDWAAQRGGDPNAVRLVNRIDRDTSGIVLASLDLAAHVALSRALENRDVGKEYRAICHGVPVPAQGEWTEPIGTPDGGPEIVRGVRADGLPSRTGYEVIETAGGRFALLRLLLHTGRQHQIRVHASHHGHALVGDWVYGARCAELPGQALHAAVLDIPHPDDGRRLRIAAPLTAALADLWARLQAGGTPTPLALSAQQRAKLGLTPG